MIVDLSLWLVTYTFVLIWLVVYFAAYKVHRVLGISLSLMLFYLSVAALGISSLCVCAVARIVEA